jgi:SAP domain
MTFTLANVISLPFRRMMLGSVSTVRYCTTRSNSAGDGFGDIKYSNFTVTKLKDILRKRRLPVSGNKADLVARLQSAFPDMVFHLDVKQMRGIPEPEYTSSTRIEGGLYRGDFISCTFYLKLYRLFGKKALTCVINSIFSIF